MSSTTTEIRDPGVTSDYLVEIGWIVAGTLDQVDFEASQAARESVKQFLGERIPTVEFDFPMIHRDELVSGVREEPVVLLDYAVTQRNIKRWDYTLVITGADLIGHYKTDALAVVSRTLESAVISTARIDPRASRQHVGAEERRARMTHRLHVLALHCLGHLMGLDHLETSGNMMFSFSTVDELDTELVLEEDQLRRLERELVGTADNRLEETSRRAAMPLRFYAHAAWLNRHEIFDAIIEAKPWQFPFRLSRLTAAAASAMLVLLVTAEVWELGTQQGGAAVGLLSFLAVTLTTTYILIRQRLFVRRERGGSLSEQKVVTNLATFTIVLAGMLSTYGLLFATTLILACAFFQPEVVAHWTNRESSVRLYGYLSLAGFIASLGIFIGSLGASFEQHHYFRHITFVDEEI